MTMFDRLNGRAWLLGSPTQELSSGIRIRLRSQSGDGRVREAMVAGSGPVEPLGHNEVSIAGQESKVARHDAHNHPRPGIHDDGATHDVAIAAESSLLVPVGEDDGLGRARPRNWWRVQMHHKVVAFTVLLDAIRQVA